MIIFQFFSEYISTNVVKNRLYNICFFLHVFCYVTIASASESASRNILNNPSFENGLKHWAVVVHTYGANAEVSNVLPVRGDNLVKLTSSPTGPTNNNGEVQLISESFSLADNAETSFSIYLRADEPDTKAMLVLHNFSKREITVGTQWQRFAVSGKTPPITKRKRQISSSASVFLLKGRTLYADAAQVELGRLTTEFHDSTLPELTIDTKRKDLVFYPGEKIEFTASMPASFAGNVHFILCDSDGNEVLRQEEETIPRGPHRIASTVIPFLKNDSYELSVKSPANDLKPDKINIICTDQLAADILKEESPVAITTSAWNLDQVAERLQRMGIKNVRLIGLLDWSQIEPVQNDWRWPDKAMAMLREKGIKPLVTLQSVPGWVVGKRKADSKTQYAEALQGWGAYISEVVRRYGGDVDDYEIWNEPNVLLKGDLPYQKMKEYTDYLEIAYQNIKRLDPHGLVYAPSAAGQKGRAFDFASTILQLKKDSIDVISFHAYTAGFSVAPDVANWEQMLEKFTHLKNQYNKPLVISEVGWREREELHRAKIIPKAICMATTAGVEKVYFFHYGGPGRWSWEGSGTNMSFVVPDRLYSPNPSFLALAAARRFFSGIEQVKKVETGLNQLWCYIFTRKKGSMAVIWKGKGHESILVNVHGSVLKNYNLFGAELSAPQKLGSLYVLDIGEKPQYITWEGGNSLTIDRYSTNVR